MSKVTPKTTSVTPTAPIHHHLRCASHRQESRTTMSKKLQDYLSKIKKQNSNDRHFPKIDSFTFSVNHRKLSKIFSGCKHPDKTLSFSIDQNYTLPRLHRKKEPHGADESERGEATLSDIDTFLVENFKSLYGNKYEDDQNDTYDGIEIEVDKNYSCHESSNGESQQDLCNSTSPSVDDGAGCSSHSTTTSYVNKSCTDEKDATVPDECIVILKQSSTFYEDFWNSMKEMIEARTENGASVDADFLQEMLLCFLNLNEKKYYRYIVSAFVNLTADFK